MWSILAQLMRSLTREHCPGCVQASVAVQERQAEPVVNPAGTLNTSSVFGTIDEEEMTAESRQCVQALREGKRCSLLHYFMNIINHGL